MLFTKEYLFLPWVIYTRTDYPFIRGVEDLRGKTISAPEDYVIADLIKENYPEITLKVIEGPSASEKYLREVAEGMVDAHIGNLTVGSYIIINHGFTNVKVAAPTPRKRWEPFRTLGSPFDTNTAYRSRIFSSGF